MKNCGVGLHLVVLILGGLCLLLPFSTGDCSLHQSCSSCVGYIISNNEGCVWCGFKGECVPESKAHHQCYDQELQHQCTTSYMSYLGVLLLSAFVCFCFGTCCLRRVAQATVPRLPGAVLRSFSTWSRDRTSLLREAIDRGGEGHGRGEEEGEEDGAGGSWVCPVCEYDNRPLTKHCDLCGGANPLARKPEPPAKEKSTAGGRGHRRAGRRAGGSGHKPGRPSKGDEEEGDPSLREPLLPPGGAAAAAAGARSRSSSFSSAGDEERGGGRRHLLVAPAGGAPGRGGALSHPHLAQAAGGGGPAAAAAAEEEGEEEEGHPEPAGGGRRRRPHRPPTTAGAGARAPPGGGGGGGGGGPLTARQRQARRRLLWARQKIADGEYRWHRNNKLMRRGSEERASIDWKPPNQHHQLAGETPQTSPSNSPAFVCEFFGSDDESEESEQDEEKAKQKIPKDDNSLTSSSRALRIRWVAAEELALTPSYYFNAPRPICFNQDEDCNTDQGLDELVAVGRLAFWEKHLWFLDRLQELQAPWSEGYLHLEVARGNLLEDSFTQFSAVDPDEVHLWLKVEFLDDEHGVDAGGLEREWFSLLFRALFDPARGLWALDAAGGAYAPSLAAPHGGHALPREYFRFSGRLVGKALMQHVPVPVRLAAPVLRQILGAPLSLGDLEASDPALFRSLDYLRRRPGTEELHLTFSVPEERLGRTVEVELEPGGCQRAVTDANKHRYLELRLRHAVLGSVEPQLEAFLGGLFEVVPYWFLSVFDAAELELLLCGLPDVDVDDWAAHTRYHGAYARRGARHPVVRWFWACLRALAPAERARLLQFCTGSARVSAHGFKTLHSSDGTYREFNITSISKEECPFPRAHTCFNKLDLPIYESKKELNEYLTLLLQSDITGFSMD